jgi:Tol biopolymer transport system component
MKFNKKGALSLLASITLVGALVTPATATFPGKNGRIALVIGPDIYAMNPDGSELRQLTNLGSDGAAFNQSWSSDGKQLVFNRGTFDNFRGQLWLMNADGSNQRLLLAEGNFDEWTPSFSPDGKSVIFTRCRLDTTEACSVYSIGVDGGTPTAITPLQVGVQDFYPVYSPDGSSVAFKGSGRGGIVQAIYRLVLGDKVHARLTPPSLDAGAPDWSPDGSTIAFSTYFEHTPQNQEIATVNSGGGDHRLLTHNGHDYYAGPHDYLPSWSPQGDAIVFERDAPDFSSASIFILKANGGAPIKLLTIPDLPRIRLAQRRKNHTLSRPGSTRRLKEILEGGALPRWGPAPN